MNMSHYSEQPAWEDQQLQARITHILYGPCLLQLCELWFLE